MTTDTIKSCLINNPVTYRSKLTLPEKENFGIEIELESVKFDEVKRLVKNQFGPSWQVKTDDSLNMGENAEIVSPVLNNTKQTWLLIKKMGKLLNHLNPSYNNCSFQINYDGSLLPSVEDKVRFLKLYAMYEDIIYRFSKGEDKTYRESLDMYASPIILSLKDYSRICDDETLLANYIHYKRYGINFKKKPKELIEFRTPNATSNIILWQNYITTFYYLLKVATSNKYNKQEVDKYIDEFSSIYVLEGYEKLKEEKALKLCNMLFNNQVDQAYFMHQYIGLQK